MKLKEMEQMINQERQEGGTRAAELEAQLEEQREEFERLQRRREQRKLSNDL